MPSEGALARLRKRAASSIVQESVDIGRDVEGDGTSRLRRVPHASNENISGVEIEETGESLKGRKRSRGDGEALVPHGRRPKDVPRADEARRGRGLVLKMTSAAGGEVRHVVPSPKGDIVSSPLMIEIGNHERWTIVDKEPLQAFEAFNLKQDADYYNVVSKEEQAMRCKRRMGRVMADFCRFADSYAKNVDVDARIALQRELDASRRSVAALEEKYKGAQEKAEVKMRDYEEQLLKDRDEVKALRAAVVEKEGLLADVNKAFDEHTALWGEEKKSFLLDVANLQGEVERSQVEADNALEEGYNLCWKGVSAAGFDLSKFTFAEYLKSLAVGEGSGNSNKV